MLSKCERRIEFGDKGAIQFVVFTNWMLPHVWEEQDATTVSGQFPHLTCRPLAADVGFHALSPMYEGQTSMGACALLGGKDCYYDGSGLAAEDLFQTLVAEGGEAVWAELEYRWHREFEPEELERLGA